MKVTFGIRRSTRNRKIDGIAEMVRELRDRGWSVAMIAKSFGLSRVSVSRVLSLG